MKEYIKYSGVLLIITMIAAAALGGIYKLTESNISEQKKLEKARALKIIFSNYDPDKTKPKYKDKEKKEELLYNIIKDSNDEILGVAFEVSVSGFSSIIKATVGMKPDGTIIGIKVIQQSETPGLGARMEEFKTDQYLWTFWKKDDKEDRDKPPIPTFQLDFFQKHYSDLVLKKGGGINPDTMEIEAITGATISSKALVNAVVEKSKEIHQYIIDEGVE